MSYFLLKICLLVNIFYLASLQLCTVNHGNCGCPSSRKPIRTSDVWARYIFSRATHEDAEYYYIDDMAFRKSLIASDSGATQHDDIIPYVYWPGGVIYYYIDSAFTPEYRKTILNAMHTLQSSVGDAHLEFVEASIINEKVCQRNYVNIKRTTKLQCQAEIGMQRGKPTGMWLNEKNCLNGTIVHELLHVLGRFHEHCRPDRDDYVTIRYGHIGTDYCANYYIMPSAWARIDPTVKLPYDIESIMHYGPCSFSCSGRFTLLRKGGTPVPSANRQRLTELDKAKLKLMFPSSTKRMPKYGCNEDKDLNVASNLSLHLQISTAIVFSWCVELMLATNIIL